MHYGMAVDIGKIREVNQDAAFAEVIRTVEGDVGLFAVIDGMGGQKSNDRGIIAAQFVHDNLLTALKAADVHDRGAVSLQSEMASIVKDISSRILSKKEIVADGAGATVTAAVVCRYAITIAHVGECRAYLMAGNVLEQLTEDHAMYAHLVEPKLGGWSDSEIRWAWVLYRAIGQAELDLDEIAPIGLSMLSDARLILCSDGIHKMLSDDEIARIVRQVDSPQAACDSLVDAANAQGGEDNMSVVVVEVEAARSKQG